MASVGGIDLEIDDADVVAGAVFLLTPDDVGAAAWTDETVDELDVDGDRVRLIDSRAVFVSLFTGAPGADDVMAEALEIAQRALDLEAGQGGEPLSLPRVDEQHIVWWRDGAQVILRLVLSRPYFFSISGGTGARRPPATWSPALRFFRLSQLSEDIFDATGTRSSRSRRSSTISPAKRAEARGRMAEIRVDACNQPARPRRAVLPDQRRRREPRRAVPR